MSVQYIRYVCPNCGKNTRENNTTQPKQCFLCKKVVCHKCSPKGFCETCLPILPEEGRTKLNRAFIFKQVVVGSVWFCIVLGFLSIAMTIYAGTADFQANNPAAETIQSVFMGIGIAVFFFFLIVAIVITKGDRRLQSAKVDAANSARRYAQQTGIPIPNVGILADYELIGFRTEAERNLRSGPRDGINEIVRYLVQNGILPGNEVFLNQVRGIVASKFRKTNDPGRAIVSFIIITSMMELMSLVEGKPYSTLNSLPSDVQGFLISAMNIQNASNIGKKVIYGS